MKKRSIFQTIKCVFKKIHLSDMSLIIFMILLIMQSIYTLFFKTPISDIDGNLDSIFRTSLASIFGYFLSANFIKSSMDKVSTSKYVPVEASSVKAPQKSVIGFSPAGSTDKKDNSQNDIITCEADIHTAETVSEMNVPTPTSANQETNVNEQKDASMDAMSQQIVITSAIGIVALITLIIFRNFIETDNAPAATISQIRDLVSASIGFLLGIPSVNNKSA